MPAEARAERKHLRNQMLGIIGFRGFRAPGLGVLGFSGLEGVGCRVQLSCPPNLYHPPWGTGSESKLF